MWRVYLDVCCLNRPFDDRSQDRVRLEAVAVAIILRQLRAGDWQWVASEVVRAEIEETPDSERRSRVLALMHHAHEFVTVTQVQATRMQELGALGFRSTDALHLACAESAAVDVFLTTDDRLLRLAARVSAQLHVRVENPLNWLEEVMM